MLKGNQGTNKLANVISKRIRREKESPLVLDFGEIQSNYSLVTNTFPVPIPKGEYTICRQLTLGKAGEKLAETGKADEEKGEHIGHIEGNGAHKHSISIPEKMRSIMPGDRVLVAWVQNEAVVVDIITT